MRQHLWNMINHRNIWFNLVCMSFWKRKLATMWCFVKFQPKKPSKSVFSQSELQFQCQRKVPHQKRRRNRIVLIATCEIPWNFRSKCMQSKRKCAVKKFEAPCICVVWKILRLSDHFSVHRVHDELQWFESISLFIIMKWHEMCWNLIHIIMKFLLLYLC